jgi:hypothetical protein
VVEEVMGGVEMWKGELREVEGSVEGFGDLFLFVLRGI